MKKKGIWSNRFCIDHTRVKMNNTVYCPNCEKVVTYTEEITKNKKGNLDGVEFFYDEKKAFCDECKTEVMPDDLHDDNIDASLDAYREVMGIISRKDVAEIPEKYAIGKRPLSVMLGWGEQTLTRYLDGKIPSKEYSDIIENIFNDPKAYKKLLCKNSEKISKVTAQKSLKAVEALIGEKDTELSADREIADPAIFATACYIKSVLPEIGKTALQKLLYYIYAFYGAFFNEPCFVTPCFAWERGPVFADVYELDKEGLCDGLIKQQRQYISPKLFNIINSVITAFGVYSGDKLTSFTHNEMPWLQYRQEENNNIVIPYECIYQYFSEIKRKFDISSPVEISNYAKYMFERCS